VVVSILRTTKIETTSAFGCAHFGHNHHNRIQLHKGHLPLNRWMAFFAALTAANRDKHAR
jgi:hypothetical protein